MERKIKILVVAPSMRNFGGQSLQAENLIRAFINHDGFQLELLENDPESIFSDIKYVRTIVKSIKFIASLIKKVAGADVVHVFSSGMSGYVIASLPPLFIAKLFYRPVLLHYHSGELEEHLQRWKLTALPTMRLFDEIVVPSEYLAQILTKYGLKAKMIPNFIHEERFRFRFRNPLRPVFLSNRNFHEHYNVADVLKAFRIISDEFPDAKIYVAGYGPQENDLKALAANLKLTSVEFVGKCTNEQMAEYYDKADIFLNTSLVDNMPLSLIEAFFCGLPVISYATGGINCLIKDGENGLLVEVGNYKEIAEKAIWLLRNQAMADRIIGEAKNKAMNYTASMVRSKWIEVYQSLIAHPTA